MTHFLGKFTVTNVQNAFVVFGVICIGREIDTWVTKSMALHELFFVLKHRMNSFKVVSFETYGGILLNLLNELT